jgi:hypothetical protein
MFLKFLWAADKTKGNISQNTATIFYTFGPKLKLLFINTFFKSLERENQNFRTKDFNASKATNLIFSQTFLNQNCSISIESFPKIHPQIHQKT